MAAAAGGPGRRVEELTGLRVLRMGGTRECQQRDGECGRETVAMPVHRLASCHWRTLNVWGIEQSRRSTRMTVYRPAPGIHYRSVGATGEFPIASAGAQFRPRANRLKATGLRFPRIPTPSVRRLRNRVGRYGEFRTTLAALF